MLRDITTTSAGVNNVIVPCSRRGPRESKDVERTVKFDAEGMSPLPPSSKQLIKAMAGEKKQKERLQRTPRKPKTPERVLIGSSSTWREEELERFKVRIGGGVVVAEDLIPERWFDFTSLQRYQEGTLVILSC
jgi:hypothetical protein